MSITPDFSVYRTVLFLDSMVTLEGKPLVSLPWTEVDPAGPILLLIVPQVMREIDKHKRDGRLARRAREFNRLVSPAAESAKPTRISDGPPAIDLAFAACDRIDWDALEDLDPDEGDARVVAQMLYARGLAVEKKILLSHDNNPIAMAVRHGLQARKMPDNWLLEPEPSPQEKDLVRLRNRVGELEAKEPKLSVDLRFTVEQPLTIYRVAPLSQSDRFMFNHQILARGTSSAWNPFTTGMPQYEQRLKRYREEIVPRHVSEFHSRMESTYNQIFFRLTLGSVGRIQAENLIVNLRTPSGSLRDKFRTYCVFGPPPPSPNDLLAFELARHAYDFHAGPHIGRHDFDVSTDSGVAQVITLRCTDFRHGSTWSFDGFACIDPQSPSPFCIDVEWTASNQRGVGSKRFQIDFSCKDVEVSELVSLEECKHLVQYPMQTALESALEAGQRDWIEFEDEGNGVVVGKVTPLVS